MDTTYLPDLSKPIEEQDALTLLAMDVWAEARGEPDEGKDAVAHVVMNRLAKAPRFGTTLAGVILKPWAFSSFNVYHHADGTITEDPNRAKMLSPLHHGSVAEWEASVAAALRAYRGLSLDTSNGATHYVVVDLWGQPCPEGRDPKWYEQPEIAAGHTIETARIGNQVFAKAA